MNWDELSQYVSKNYKKRNAWNVFMCVLLALAAVVALIPLFSIFAYVIRQGLPALNWSFIKELPKPVGEISGGMANSLVGSMTLIALASLVGVPWGMATGIYLSEFGSRNLSLWSRTTSALIRFSVDMHGSVPSIIIGLFVYAIAVKPMKHFSALAGGLALGLIMIPTIARSTEEFLKLVPTHIREAGLALGLPRWKVILWVVVRGSAKAITTGIMLAVARVAGETAPLLFTAFSNRYWQQGLMQPISSLPVQIYTYAISPFDDWHNQAWAGALVLLIWVFAMNVITRMALRSPDGSGAGT